MSPGARVYLIVGVVAALAAGATVGATALTSDRPEEQAPAPRAGAPPLVLDLGVRADPEARALRRASVLYDRGQRARARRIFARYPSLEAQVGAALAAWPESGGVADLAAEHPRSALVQLHLGFARFWTRDERAATAAWRRAARLGPDSLYGVRASDLLHPRMPPGLPIFVPSFPPPPELQRLSPPEQLAFLARRARDGGARDKLLYGVALQRLGRPHSAERQFAAAAELAPRDADAQVAAAVGRFTKDRPERAFSRLGPLARLFPRAPTVRFHLGLMLLWLARVDEAERQLRLAHSLGPGTALGREAQRVLVRLENSRTQRPNK